MSELKEYEVRIGRKLYQTLPPIVYVVADDNQPKLLNDKVYLKSEADKVIARYKYKHCLDMAYKCVKLCQKSKDRYRWAEDENLEHYYNHKIEFFARWHNRWLELAEQFKEAK